MNLFKAIAYSAAKREHILLLLLLVVVSGAFVHHDTLWRWDNLIYDTQLSLWARDVSDDIVIIAVDDESLKQLGRWPWPRAIHADLINKIDLESPRVIGLDIIFSEPDSSDPLSDVALSEAIKSSGKVVLPLFMTTKSNNSVPIEALPLPEFTNNTAALGHVHIDVSDDGVARKVYLKEGIGEPQWLHYSLALLSVVNGSSNHSLDLTSENENVQYSPLRWAREHPYLIPFAGPSGHFQQIGYAQVLAGQYEKNLFHDKIVLVGTTAEGLGDALPTPLSGSSGAMPGVEIIANVVDAINNDIYINEIEKSWQIIITVLLVLLPLVIYPRLNPAHALWVLFSVIALTVVLVGLLLLLFGLWLPISTALLFQFIGYPLWSWRRLEMSMRHINQELDQLFEMHRSLSMRREKNIVDEVKFVSKFIPLDGWVIQNEGGEILISEGVAPVYAFDISNAIGWNTDGLKYWAYTCYQGNRCIIGLSLSSDTVFTDTIISLLNGLIEDKKIIEVSRSRYNEDVLRTKIQQVQLASNEYKELRQIVDDSLSGMAHGVLICSRQGQVMLSNRRAGWYLLGDDSAELNGKSLGHLLQSVQLNAGENWNELLQRLILDQDRVHAQARHEEGRDLMIEMSPLKVIDDGLVINLTDISLLKASERKRNEVLNFLSHDLRSPLASMIAMIELARNKEDIEEVRSLLLGMENNTQKTLHLAEQFLQLSRATASENIRFYDIDFNSVVLNAIDQIWALSEKMNVTIQYDFSNEELWTHAEPDLLERAVVNLLSNAIKHSEAGAIVTVTVKLHNNEISCCIDDVGSGISIDELPHLFEMFMRVKSVGLERKKGIGLGLAFVDAVAKRHSGHVDVESKQGEGSSFCLKFPQLALRDDKD